MELTTGELFIYNLDAETLQTVQLARGRGPTEYHSVSSLAVSNGNVYLSDPINGKILIYKIESGTVSRMPLKEKNQFLRMELIGSDSLFVTKFFNPDDWTGVINLSDPHVYIGNLQGLSITEEFPNLYYHDGTLAIAGSSAVYATLYRPHIYRFDSKSGDFQERIIFDREAETVSSPGAMQSGRPMMPERVDVITRGVYTVPNRPNSVFLNLDGEGAGGQYSTHHLYEFDLERKRFRRTLDVGYEVTQMASNSQSMFVYTDSTNTIYKYEIYNK